MTKKRGKTLNCLKIINLKKDQISPSRHISHPGRAEWPQATHGGHAKAVNYNKLIRVNVSKKS